MVTDCAGHYYSPSNEDNKTITDPNGNVCIGYDTVRGHWRGGDLPQSKSTDALGYCCGTCNDATACGEDENGCIYCSSNIFIPNFVAPGLPISLDSNRKFSLSQVIGLPPTIQF
jgi:hypothetical protein